MSRILRNINNELPPKISNEKEVLELVENIKQKFKTDDIVKINSGNEDDVWKFLYVATKNDFGRVDPKVVVMNQNEERMIINPKDFLDYQK